MSFVNQKALNGILYAVALIFALNPFFNSTIAASSDSESSDIQDVIATHRFIAIGDIYTDGTDKFLCVETDTHEYGLWNPRNDHLSAVVPAEQRKTASKKDKCEHSGLNPLGTDQELNHMMVNRLPVGGVLANDSGHSNFSNGGTLSLVFDMYSPRCGPNLSSYFTLTHSDGKTESFYIVVRFEKPLLYVAENCDDSGDDKQELMQEFDSIGHLESVDLNDGRTLLFSRMRFARNPVILVVRKIPKSVWSSNDNVFIIPAKLLRPFLLKDGWIIKDLSLRYNALLRVIGEQH